MGGENLNRDSSKPLEQTSWEPWRGAEQSREFGRLPRDVLVTAWFVAFIPVIAVFFIWLTLYARSHSGNQQGNGGPGSPVEIYNTYTTPFQGASDYPSAQNSSQVPPSSPTADPTSEATGIDNVLRQTASDRKSAAAAVADLAACGATNGMSSDVRALQAAQSDRTSLVSQLQSDPVDQLAGGAQAVQLLQSALQDSATADGDFAQAGQDFANNPSTCTGAQMTQDSNFLAGQNEDATATADKTSFTTAWNPIAQQYGLQQWDQSGF